MNWRVGGLIFAVGAVAGVLGLAFALGMPLFWLSTAVGAAPPRLTSSDLRMQSTASLSRRMFAQGAQDLVVAVGRPRDGATDTVSFYKLPEPIGNTGLCSVSIMAFEFKGNSEVKDIYSRSVFGASGNVVGDSGRASGATVARCHSYRDFDHIIVSSNGWDAARGLIALELLAAELRAGRSDFKKSCVSDNSVEPCNFQQALQGEFIKRVNNIQVKEVDTSVERQYTFEITVQDGQEGVARRFPYRDWIFTIHTVEHLGEGDPGRITDATMIRSIVP
jgi:hypothetical protein